MHAPTEATPIATPAQGKARSAWRRVRQGGLPDLRFHDLRHNYATQQLAAGTSIHATADLLGHSDAGLVYRRYGHAIPAEVASAAERLAAWREAPAGRPLTS